MVDMLAMLKSCGINVPVNVPGNAPDLPRILWHDGNKSFPGETMLAARDAAQQKFGAEPDIIFICLPSQEKVLYQEVGLLSCQLNQQSSNVVCIDPCKQKQKSFSR